MLVVSQTRFSGMTEIYSLIETFQVKANKSIKMVRGNLIAVNLLVRPENPWDMSQILNSIGTKKFNGQSGEKTQTKEKNNLFSRFFYVNVKRLQFYNYFLKQNLKIPKITQVFLQRDVRYSLIFISLGNTLKTKNLAFIRREKIDWLLQLIVPLIDLTIPHQIDPNLINLFVRFVI